VSDAPRTSRDALREATLSGLPWFAGARFVIELCGLVAGVLLARLLTPDEIGRAVIALIFGALTSSFFGEGLANALTQRREEDERTYRAAAFAAAALGAVFTVLVATLGVQLATVVWGAETASYVLVLSPIFLLSAFAVVPRARLQRRLAFRTIGIVDAAATLTWMVVAVTLAAAGWDGRSMVVGNVANAAVGLIGFTLVARHAVPRPDRASLRELYRFGLPASLSSMLYLGVRNIDYAIIGAVLNTRQVGLYQRAFTLGQEYQAKISGIMLRMALPVYSRAEDIEHMRSIRRRISRVHATVLFPLLALLAVIAPTFVPWFYGPQWVDAVVPTQILALAGMVAAVLSGTGPLILALGRAKEMLWWNVGTFVVYTAIIFATASHGLIAVCLGVLAFQAINFVGAHVLLLQGIAGIPFRESLKEIAPAFICAVALAVFAWPLYEAARALELPALMTLAVPSIIGGLVYVAVLALRFPAAFGDVMTLVHRLTPARLRRRARRTAPVGA
jgi:PST family polysaccharide transporter